MINRMIDQMVEKASEIVADRKIPVLERLTAVILAFNSNTELGIFHTEFKTEAIEMIILYANTMFDDLAEQNPEQRQQRMQGFIYHSERILGTERGMLHQAIMDIFKKAGSNKE